jgi:hypothetical protein
LQWCHCAKFYIFRNFRSETLENKAKFEKEVLIQKEPVVKASEKVKIENQKRGTIENNTSNDFVITSF